MKAGGSAHVNQAKSWPLIANSLGFTGPNDASAPVELAHAYMNLVAPFEEFLKVRQTHQRSTSQTTQQHLSSTDPSRQNSPLTPSPVGSRPPMTQSQSFENLQAAQVQPVREQPSQIPQHSMVSPHTSFQSPSPVHGNRMGSQQPPPSIGVSPRHMTPDMSISRSPSASTQGPPSRSNSLSLAVGARTRADTLNSEMPPPKQVAPSPGPLRKMTDIPATAPSPVSKPTIKSLIKLPNQEGKYLPKKRKRAADGGYNISELLRIGADVDTLVPDFPLFQELGSVEINSIIMALQSMIQGEVRQALDKLALLSSNPAVGIVLRECPGLVTALGMVGMDLLNNLKAGKKVCTVDVLTGNAPGDEVVDYESEKDLICSVFNAYRSWDDRNDDLVVQIDSLTGEPVDAAKGDDEAIETLNAIIAADDDDFRQENGTPDGGGFGAMEMSGTFGFTHYQDMLDASKEETNAMHREPKSQLGKFWQDALADRFLCVTLILRNLSFPDINQSVMVQDAGTLKLLFEMVRALADYPELLGSMRRKLCLQKDLVTLFANLGLYISIPTVADAFSVLLLVLSFAPEDTPYRPADPGSSSKPSTLMFAEYSPLAHRYLACAIDALAKLIARDPPNRDFFKEIFLNICTDQEHLILLNRFLQGRPALQPYEFLTRAFALAIAPFPRTDFRVIPKALEIRRPLLQQSLLIADILVSMIPALGALDDNFDAMSALASCPDQYAALQAQRQSNVALEWLDAAEGFGPTLLRAACALGGLANPRASQRGAAGVEVNPFAKITQRSISLLKTLTEKAMVFEVASLNSTDFLSSPSEPSVIPQASTTTTSTSSGGTSLVFKTQAKLPGKIFPTLESILGAMLSGTMSDSVVRHLCSLSEDRASFLATLQKLER